jgi:hypothetical protein
MVIIGTVPGDPYVVVLVYVNPVLAVEPLVLARRTIAAPCVDQVAIGIECEDGRGRLTA